MLAKIKRLIAGLNSRSLASYYQSRLESSRTMLEREAIIYTPLYDWDEEDKK